MAKKRVQYPNRLRNNILTGVVCGVLAVGLAVLVGLNVKGRDWVFKLNGKKVAQAEFLGYSYMQKVSYESFFNSFSQYGYDMNWGTQASEDGTSYAQGAMQSAMTQLQQQYIAENELKKRSSGGNDLLKLTDEQVQAAVEQRDSILQAWTVTMLEKIGMSDKALLKWLEKGNYTEMLYNELVKDYVFDAADFDTYVKDYIANNRLTVEKHNVNYIYNDNREELQKAYDAAMSGKDIYELIKEYSTDYYEPVANDDGTPSEDFRMSPGLLSDIYQLNNEEKLALYDLKEGAFSGIIDIVVAEAVEADPDNDIEAQDAVYSYMFIKVDSIELPSEEEQKTELRETYENEKKSEIYQEKYTALLEDYNFEYNETLLNSFDITTLPL